jgi:hypothetical protein
LWRFSHQLITEWQDVVPGANGNLVGGLKHFICFQILGTIIPFGYGAIPINTIFRGLFTSINPSYFDVNRRGTIGFDTLPFEEGLIIL